MLQRRWGGARVVMYYVGIVLGGFVRYNLLYVCDLHQRKSREVGIAMGSNRSD